MNIHLAKQKFLKEKKVKVIHFSKSVQFLNGFYFCNIDVTLFLSKECTKSIILPQNVGQMHPCKKTNMAHMFTER